MKAHIQSFRSLIEEMKGVASGARKPTRRTSKRIFESNKAASAFAHSAAEPKSRNLRIASIESVVRLLTSENQQLVKVIAGGKAGSVAQLAEMTRRAESNVTRTLKKFESLGLVTLSRGPGRTKVPKLTVNSVSFRVDFAKGKVVVLNASPAAEPDRAPIELVAKDHRSRAAR